MLVANVVHDIVAMSDIHRIVSGLYHTILNMFSLSSNPHYVLTVSISLILMGYIHKFYILVASVVHDLVVMSNIHRIVSGLYHIILNMLSLSSIIYYLFTGSISFILIGCLHKFFVLVASVVRDIVVMSEIHRIVSGLYHTIYSFIKQQYNLSLISWLSTNLFVKA